MRFLANISKVAQSDSELLSPSAMNLTVEGLRSWQRQACLSQDTTPDNREDQRRNVLHRSCSISFTFLL